MSETIFDRVRRTCAAVAAVSTHVRIHEDRVAELADRLDLDRPAIDPVRFVVASALDDAAYASGLWRGLARRFRSGVLLPRLGRSSPGA